MGSDNNMDFKKELLKAIQIMIDETVGNYKADRTFTSVIKQKNLNGTYVVLDESGGERTVKCCIPNVSFNVGQRVYVTIPSSDLKRIFISGVA